ncbi:hypothetical protein TNCV_5050551 [Trichonephila clavipes]|nr:hypothetical protein TNCV_5050551 [Trichonephila clavipes]
MPILLLCKQVIASSYVFVSLVVKITDLWLACHELEPNAAEDPPCRGGSCAEAHKRPPIDLVWKLLDGVPAQKSSSSLDYGSKL